jgi:hypothetical protein
MISALMDEADTEYFGNPEQLKCFLLITGNDGERVTYIMVFSESECEEGHRFMFQMSGFVINHDRQSHNGTYRLCDDQ